MTPAELNDFLSHALAWVITGLIAYGARSVAKLNENIVVIIQRLTEHDGRLVDHESRLRDVELRHVN